MRKDTINWKVAECMYLERIEWQTKTHVTEPNWLIRDS
jgi:hypothetical protein